MVTRVSFESAKACVEATGALMNGGTLEIRSGDQPDYTSDPATGIVLASFTLPSPAFGAAVNINPGAQAAANAVASVTAVASGDARWFRAYKAGGSVPVVDGSISQTDGQGDMKMNNTDILQNGDVKFVSWLLRHPE